MLLTITLDSTASGWRGALAVSALGKQPVDFVSVTRHQDSIVMRLPASAHEAELRGSLTADGRELAGTVTSDANANFRVARAGSPEAATLTASARRVEEARRIAQSLVDTTKLTPTANPDSARLVTSDIALFWSVVDRAPNDSLAAYLERDYLERGSAGLRDFIPGRILSAEDLATYVNSHRARYDSSRAANLDVKAAEREIRAAFRRLKELYPPAVFPNVYFVVGRFNSGGTSTDHGLLIGSEMYREATRLPAIVSHELIHYQQHCEAPTLLAQSFMEGSADFLGHLISGAEINGPARTYGVAHEHQLWQEFTPHFADREFYPWMYGTPTDGRPNDLGYFIGSRIAEAYYNQTSDKRRAIAEIIGACGDAVKQILATSRYNP
jgi:hypothetical protein